jgi:hypothetical protein
MAFLKTILFLQLIVPQTRKIKKTSTPLFTEGKVDYEDDKAIKILRHFKNPQKLIFLHLFTQELKVSTPTGGKGTKRENRRECKLSAGNFL